MQATVKIDSSRMQSYLRNLAGTLPVTIEQVIRAETGTILKDCVLQTKVRPIDKVLTRAQLEGNRSVRRRLYGPGKSVERGQMWRVGGARDGARQGRVWFRVPRGNGAKFLLLKGSGGANIWGAGRPKKLRGRGGIGISVTKSVYPSQKLMMRAEYFDTQVKQDVKVASARGKQSRGLARQSWVHIGDAAGIPLESVRGGRNASAAIAKARMAIASDGKRYRNGRAQMIGGMFKKVLRIQNVLPYARAARLDAVLARVIAGRIGYADRVFKNGILTKAKDVAKAYPNIHVSVN